MKKITFAGVSTAALLACNDLPERLPPLEYVERSAVIRHYDDPVRITAPDTVEAGEEVRVAVTSYGGGCVRKGRLEVHVSEHTVELRPYDEEQVQQPRQCFDVLALHQHIAPLRFQHPGEVVLRVHGIEEPGTVPITAERTLMVVPVE